MFCLIIMIHLPKLNHKFKKCFLSGFYWVFVVEKVFFSGRNALEESFRAFGEASKKTGQVSASVQGGASPCPGLCRESPLGYIAFSHFWERTPTHGKSRWTLTIHQGGLEVNSVAFSMPSALRRGFWHHFLTDRCRHSYCFWFNK